MKPRLQTSLGQHLVMTPQLRQAIRLLQLSTAELEIEIASAVESNPLLDWEEAAPQEPAPGDGANGNGADHDDAPPADASAWDGDEPWYERIGPADSDDEPLAEQVAESETLQDHLLWQLHLSHLSPRDRTIGVAVIEAIDDDGYLRETDRGHRRKPAAPRSTRSDNEILTVLHQVQRFDPPGVGARSLNECLQLQLALLPDETPGRELAKKHGRRPAGTPAAHRPGGPGERTASPARRKSKQRCTCCARSTRAPARRWAACRPTPTSRPTAWCGASKANGASRSPPARGRASRSIAATNA